MYRYAEIFSLDPYFKFSQSHPNSAEIDLRCTLDVSSTRRFSKNSKRHLCHPEWYIPPHLLGVLGVLGRLPELIASGFIDGIQVTLVQKHKEDYVVSEAGEAVHGRHGDDERKEVVDERVDELVCHHPPRHMRHALELFRSRAMEERSGCLGFPNAYTLAVGFSDQTMGVA